MKAIMESKSSLTTVFFSDNYTVREENRNAIVSSGGQELMVSGMVGLDLLDDLADELLPPEIYLMVWGGEVKEVEGVTHNPKTVADWKQSLKLEEI